MNTAQAVGYFGSKKKLADALGVTPSAITFWGEAVPAMRQFQLQILTRGALQASAIVGPALNKSSPIGTDTASGSDGSVDLSSANACGTVG